MKEKLSISFFCYEQHKPFTVTFSRLLETEDKLKIEAIIRTELASGTALQTESAENADIHKAAMSDLDFKGFFCPHCANRSFVRCGTCGAMSCLAKDWDRSKSLSKPCGHGGVLSGVIKEIDSRKVSPGHAVLTGSGKRALGIDSGDSAWKG